MPRNVLQTLTVVALVAAIIFVAHNFVRYVLRVDGGYSEWTVFTQCTKTCGTGTRFRTRKCDNPAPRFTGLNCSILGEDIQTFKCNMLPCPDQIGIGKFVFEEEEEIDLSNLRISKAFEVVGMEQIGNQLEAIFFDGGYGAWSNFGECSVTCGEGVQQRERRCDSPEPMFGGLSCDKLELGPSIETKACEMESCPVNGGYGPWGEFGECSVTCGGGVKQRERKCDQPEPKYGGKTCEEQELGTNVETQSCSEEPCPVDGGYSEWTDLSECTVTCGGGVQERSRECTNPKPANGGRNCEGLGPSMESQECNTQACPPQPAQDQGKEQGKSDEGNKGNENKKDEKEQGNDGKIEKKSDEKKQGNEEEAKKEDKKEQ